MGKSRAEIQKAYRERRALREGHAYRKKEVERVKKYYVPTSDLTSSARKKGGKELVWRSESIAKEERQ